jgi:hypothetical protein
VRRNTPLLRRNHSNDFGLHELAEWTHDFPGLSAHVRIAYPARFMTAEPSDHFLETLSCFFFDSHRFGHIRLVARVLRSTFSAFVERAARMAWVLHPPAPGKVPPEEVDKYLCHEYLANQSSDNHGKDYSIPAQSYIGALVFAHTPS